ncbi:MAG: glycoside hydrolase family 2 [Planctomycetes bacterium B3_Pla]|nr:MAG: glycoside hydrolase family 2 [Planctomycetes bacterium B3_Pla]
MKTGDSRHDRLLSDGWMICTSANLEQTPEEICRADFDIQDWHSTSVPSTVLAALVANGVYKDPYFGMNLKEISSEPFEKPWWCRTKFQLSKTDAEKTTLLEFDGINYSANIWLNGRQIAASTQVKGAFRRFQFDISSCICKGSNVLAVEVVPPEPGDFSTGFVDWNPPPPDRNMGIIRGVRLRFCENVSIENPFVQTNLNAETLDEATLTASAGLANHADRTVSGILEGKIESIRFSEAVEIEPQGRKTVEFTDIRITNPRIWWPHTMGKPDLYDLQLKFTVDDKVSDADSVRFGIRKVEDYTNEAGHKGFKINGRKVLIKAAGWTDDLFLADTLESIDAQLKYVKHINLNSIRLEGIWGKDHTLYDLCDKYGILMMVGWSCHWEHEQYLGKPVDGRYGGVTSSEDIDLISKSWQDQVIWLRNHPSIYVWAVASDKVPKPQLEQRYIETFEKYDPSRPYLASTGGIGSEQQIIGEDIVVSEISGCSGVKMLGPYAYTPPVYWYTDKNRGGAYGFNTETGPGAAVPPLESIRKMIPEDHLWPIDEFWEFHCGLNEFATLDRYREAIDRRYGKAGNVKEFARKAQVLNYELMRPMFEAFRANKGAATGVVQWMLNAAWPKMYWQLYDKYLMPNGAFYAAKKACEPLHLLYNYGDRSVYAMNDHLATFRDLRATIRVLDIDSMEVFGETLDISVEPDSSAKVFELPEFDSISTTYFLDLRLHDDRVNFYWLSTKPDVPDYEAKVEPWPYYTPSKKFADFTSLNSLPPAGVKVKHSSKTTGEKTTITAKLANVSDKIAFFLELQVAEKNSGKTILPVFWQDNYVSLLPGETRNIKAVFPATKQETVLTIDGWNLET